MIDETLIAPFLETLMRHYHRHGRHELPWRTPASDGSFDAYKILVSEIMLQQTQVVRVVPKYLAFLEQFPDVQALASAELGAVLRAWSGLGYNRRAKYVWQAAQTITNDYHGSIPNDAAMIGKLSGVGSNTAGAILAYAYNQSALFIETNIRTVYIHHFFATYEQVHDKDILTVLAATLDYENPRQFYWALMDYGSYLKQTYGNLNKKSKSYAKQSAFQGSRRQIRGHIIRELTKAPQHLEILLQVIPDARTEEVVTELLAEGLLHDNAGLLTL